MTIGAVTFRAVYGTMDDTAFPSPVGDETKVQTKQRTVRLASADLPKNADHRRDETAEEPTKPNRSDALGDDTEPTGEAE